MILGLTMSCRMYDPNETHDHGDDARELTCTGS